MAVIDDLSTGREEHITLHARTFIADLVADADHIIQETRPEVVFHLAAQTDLSTSVADPVHDAVANIIGTIRVLEGARRVGAKVVFASSGGAIYGECSGPVSVGFDPQPASPYAVSKLAGEAYLRAWGLLHGLQGVVLRFANVYGPRQMATLEGGVVAIFLERLLAGKPATIYGDGTQTRDFVYVADVIDACVDAAGFPHGIFNVGTGRETNIIGLLHTLADELGVEPDVVYAAARTGDLQRSCLNVDRLREMTGRHPTALREGLARTIAWVREHEASL